MGPFIKLVSNKALRRLVLDVASTLITDCGRHEELLASIQKAVLATGDLDYWKALESQHIRLL